MSLLELKAHTVAVAVQRFSSAEPQNANFYFFYSTLSEIIKKQLHVYKRELQ